MELLIGINLKNNLKKFNINAISLFSIPPNIRGSVYKYSIQNSNDYQDWFNLSGVYDLTVDPQERTLVLDAIAQTRLNWILDT